jgi:hypothetical protein
MNRNISSDRAVIGVCALDDAHMTWIAAEAASGHALNSWFKAAASDRAAAYVAYVAALDREEAAARDFQRLGDLKRLSDQGVHDAWRRLGMHP